MIRTSAGNTSAAAFQTIAVEWQMVNGKWQMVNGKCLLCSWQIANRKLCRSDMINRNFMGGKKKLTCEKPPSELKLPRGLPKAIVAVVSRLADVMRRICSGLTTRAGRGLPPFELRRLNIEKPLPEDCESGV